MNQCADSLASMSFSQKADFSSFASLLVDVVNVFEDDLNGMYSNKMCPKLIVTP